MTSAGIEPATFRFVAQRLNHCATAGCIIYFKFISIINLYMFRAGLLLIIRWYYSVYTAVYICHAFMLTGCWQGRLCQVNNAFCWFLLYGYITIHGKQNIKLVWDIIIIFINCNWVVTQWQWLNEFHTDHTWRAICTNFASNSVVRSVSSLRNKIPHKILEQVLQEIMFQTLQNTGLSKKMDGIWNPYNLKSTGRIYTFGILKCSEKFKVLGLP